MLCWVKVVFLRNYYMVPETSLKRMVPFVCLRMSIISSGIRNEKELQNKR